MGNHKILKTAGIDSAYSMYDFIDAVKMHSIIWNHQHADFHNRELRDQAWHQIGQRVCQNFDASTDREKQEIAKTLLKRWKNTRDSFWRVHRLRQTEGPTGKDSSPRPAYIYDKELSFLLTLDDDKSEVPAKEEPKAQIKRRSAPAIHKYTRRRRSSNSAEGEGLLDNLNCLEESSPQPQETHTNLSTMSSLKAEVPVGSDPTASTTTVVSAGTDPDQAFFDSIKPHMQKMTNEQKLDFQIEMLKILRKFRPSN